MEKNCGTRPIPTPNTNNYYSTLYGEYDDKEDKIIIHSNCTNKVITQTNPLTGDDSIESIESTKQETMFNKSNINIEANQAIADSGATGNFILPGSPLKNIQPATRPLVIHLPDGKTLQSTHTGKLDIPWLSKAATQAHVVPGLSHTSLVYINMLCNGGCKVSYEEDKCLILYKNRIVWQGTR